MPERLPKRAQAELGAVGETVRPYFSVTSDSHVGQVLEGERLVELGIEVLPVHLGLVLGLLVRQQVDLATRPTRSGAVASHN